MTVTLDLTDAEEARLTAAARRAGVAPDALLRRLVHSLPPTSQRPPQEVEDARAAAIWAARGSLAHVGATTDDLHRQRQADKEAEERPATREASRL